MQDKRWILGLVIVILVVAGLSIWGFKKNDTEKNTTTEEVAGENISPNYFSEDASVMFFYSDYCSWCLKEKEVLQKLGNEGYKVKSMNVGENTNLWTEYNIQGTPTFIAKSGDRLEGYKDYESLKSWLDQHK